MTATNHALTGTVIALVIKQPALAIPLSFLSHYLVDAIPHFSFADRDLFRRNFNTLLILDAISCILLVGLIYLLFPARWFVISFCAFLATSPDLAWAYYRLYLEKIKGRFVKYDLINRLHSRLQASSHNKYARRGIRNELAWLCSMSIIIGLYV